MIDLQQGNSPIGFCGTTTRPFCSGIMQLLVAPVYCCISPKLMPTNMVEPMSRRMMKKAHCMCRLALWHAECVSLACERYSVFNAAQSCPRVYGVTRALVLALALAHLVLSPLFALRSASRQVVSSRTSRRSATPCTIIDLSSTSQRFHRPRFMHCFQLFSSLHSSLLQQTHTNLTTHLHFCPWNGCSTS